MWLLVHWRWDWIHSSMSGSVSPIEHHTGPSQNTRAQKRKLEEILEEVPNHKFNDQLLCFKLRTSLNSDEDVVKVMGADVPLVVQAQAFPELASLYWMQWKAVQDQKDYEEMLEMAKMRQREYDIEAVRNDLIILNRFYPRGGHSRSSPIKSLLLPTQPTSLPSERRCHQAVLPLITHRTHSQRFKHQDQP